MTVKADSKGRLTGAQPSERYRRAEAPDGVITYTPLNPKTYDELAEVSWKEFTDFFGVAPDQVAADGISLIMHNKISEGHIPTGFLVSKFVFEDGARTYSEGVTVKTQTLIRIRKES